MNRILNESALYVSSNKASGKFVLRTNWSLASLDDTEKPRGFSDVSLTHFVAEPHSTICTSEEGEGKRGEGEGEGRGRGRGREGEGEKGKGLFHFNSVITKNNFHALEEGEILCFIFKFNSMILILCMLEKECGSK